MPRLDPQRLAEKIAGGDRRALARAITLAESTRQADRRSTLDLLKAVPGKQNTVRIGVSGPPGAGKSTFIEVFGLHLISLGKKVAVLAVDPSSPRSGGSILGDKTRMERLSRKRDAFVRPSPSGGTLGGVARRTREAITLCEAGGFDIAIVETVGTGQSEAAVADLVDVFLLLLAPGGGDELQGMKRGIVELADIIVVNKADGAFLPAAERTRTDYENAVHLLAAGSSRRHPPVLLASALEETGVDAIWRQIGRDLAALGGQDGINARRAGQARAWMWSAIDEGLRSRLTGTPSGRQFLAELEEQVAAGATTPTEAAERALDRLLGNRS
ncbi:MAG: methylmalonyl Co-A mutase-associated GTPase MeaB [Rhodospirillales bacterium]|nr:methylmalonyl Co-A mutase-associated GTPase MeaB [Rhodospirillales bacterium]